MKIKLIAIDVDGTLLNNNHEITPTVKNAITMAKNKGIYIILTTGRPYIGMKKYLFELDLQKEGNFCIVNNGALTYRTIDDCCISQYLLNIMDYQYLEGISRKLGIHFHAVDSNNLYTANPDVSEYTIYESSLTGMPFHLRNIKNMNENMTFSKFMMVDKPKILDEAIKNIPKIIFSQYTVVKSAPYYLEFFNKSTNKGIAVKKIANKLGFNRNNVMTLGDQENDLSMIKYAKIGVAMGNAIESIKEASQFITLSNSEDGVALAIHKFAI